MKGIRINKSIEVFFVILIIIGLCISAVVLMDAGKKAYGRILDNNNRVQNARIAISYLGMRIRQNDTMDSITYIPKSDSLPEMLKLRHSGVMEGAVTYIYFDEGELREIFTLDSIEPDPDYSKAIIEIDDFDMVFNDGHIKFKVHYLEDGQMKSMEQIIGLIGDR